MGTALFSGGNSSSFTTSTSGFGSSVGVSNTAIVYDLISEGPIKLVNGLNSIYLNRTPIANESQQQNIFHTQYDTRADYGSLVMSSTSSLTFTHTYITNEVRPILLIGGGGSASLASITEGSATVTTTGSFFTNSMLASNTAGDAGLYQKIRVRDTAGTNYFEAEVKEIVSSTQAVLDRVSPFTASSGTVTWDHYSLATMTTTGATLSTAAAVTPTYPTILVGGKNELNYENTSSSTNFRDVKVAFRSGTLNQGPVINFPSFGQASYGVSPNTEIKQFTDYFNANKLGSWIGGPGHELPGGATSGGEVIVTSSQLGGTASEIDELQVTINFPSGLNLSDSKNSSTNLAGVTFQIFFEYRTTENNTTTPYVSKLMFGPTTQEVNSAYSYAYMTHNGTPISTINNKSGDVISKQEVSFDYAFRFNIEEFKPFTSFRIVVRRVTPVNYNAIDKTYLVYNNASTLKNVQAYITDKLTYPHSAYAAIQVDSNEFNGQLPERRYHCYGVQVEVPTNYTTDEEASNGVPVYSGLWNGTFRRAYSSNPVWNLREILLNKRWGLGNWLSASDINDYSLYSLARYCDELVPNGEGGLEPRFTCGVYLTQATEAYKVIKDFCTTMLALPYWVDGKFILEGDRPGEPVYIFTKGNVIDGAFSYEGTGTKTRPNQIIVTFNDRDNFYEQAVEIYDDVEDIVLKNRIFPEEVVAFGATSRSQAIRYAKWKLLTSKMQKEIVSFRTGENAGYLRPGSIIGVQDADKNGVRFSGRISSAASTTQVTLDSSVTLQAGYTYYLHCLIPGAASYLAQPTAVISTITYVQGDILPNIDTEEEAAELVDDSGNPVYVQFSPDSHIETRTITTSAGTVSTVTVGTAFSATPQSELIWAITAKQTSSNLETTAGVKEYKILGIAEESPGIYAITAAEHYNSKFDLVDEEYIADAPQTVSYLAEIPPVTNLTAAVSYKSLSAQSGGNDSADVQLADIVLTWSLPTVGAGNLISTYPDLGSVVIKYENSNRQIIVIELPPNSTSYTVENVLSGSYEFSVQVKSIAGPISRPKFAKVSVINNRSVPGQITQTGLIKGGTFSRPVILSDDDVTISTYYKFTSPTGVEAVISNGVKV
jgi:predicted phage tail protein